MKKPMMLVLFSLMAVFGIIFIAAATDSRAGEADQNGFTGYVSVGVTYSQGDLSLNDASEDDNQLISSLNQTPEDISEVSLFVGGELNYRFESTGTMISLNGEDGLGLVISQPVEKLGLFSIGGTHDEQDVWQDPFVTGAVRTKSDRQTIGLDLGWDDILDTPVYAGYRFRSIDIDRDLAAGRDVRLDREGEVHTFILGGRLFNRHAHAVSGGLAWEIGDLNGSSMAYDGIGVALTHTYRHGKWEIETTFSFMNRDHDGVHPEFNKTRNEKEYDIGTVCTLYDPFGFNGYFISLYGGYAAVDANIGFYDSSIIFAGTAVGFYF